MEKTEIKFKRTRIAPTPSGYLHLGNILSFAITAALAKKHKSSIFLRIDDLDRERTNKLYVQDIFDTLNFLEIPWDEGPRNLAEYEQIYSQVHRIDIYQSALRQLRDDGHVFACTCTRAQVISGTADGVYAGTCRSRRISLDAEGVSWRLDTAAAGELKVKKLSGTISAAYPASMRDFIVKKKDGYPAYQLISVLDDLHFGVDMVVRGEDLWPSTVAQHHIASCLGMGTFGDIRFYHHPLIVDDSGKKLSKSEGATSVHHLRKEHKTPSDIYSLIAEMLGISASPATWEQLVAFLDV